MKFHEFFQQTLGFIGCKGRKHCELELPASAEKYDANTLLLANTTPDVYSNHSNNL